MTEHKKRTPPVILDHSDEEEARIQRAIADDPDTWEATGPVEAWAPPPVRRARALGLPHDAFFDNEGRLRARPDLGTADADSVPVALELDRDVFLALKSADAEGWQERANALLRKAVGL